MADEPDVAAEADPPRQRILPTGRREITGEDEQSLLDAIAEGVIPRPELTSYNAWISWRRSHGRRPRMPLGDREPTTPGEESAFWRGVMEALYGPNWRLDLLEAQEAEELAVEEDRASGRRRR